MNTIWYVKDYWVGTDRGKKKTFSLTNDKENTQKKDTHKKTSQQKK